MKKFIVYNQNSKILRTGGCSDSAFSLQTESGEFIIEGQADDVTQKIEFDGFDEKGQPINPRVVDKTIAEIEADNPSPSEVPFEKQTILLTNKQWQDVLSRLKKLEIKT